jgi:hypothetical protein
VDRLSCFSQFIILVAPLLAWQSLKEVLTAQVPVKQEEMKQLKAEYGSKSLGEVTVDQV